MGIFRGTTRFAKKQLNVKQWIGYKDLKANAQFIYKRGKSVFKIRKLKAEDKETFGDAVHRLHLSEEDLKERYDICKTYFTFFMIFAVAAFAYALYLFYISSTLGGILAFAVTAMIGAQAFRYHFWMFQIKNKKLGCTLDEWRSGELNKNNNKNNNKA